MADGGGGRAGVAGRRGSGRRADARDDDGQRQPGQARDDPGRGPVRRQGRRADAAASSRSSTTTRARWAASGRWRSRSSSGRSTSAPVTAAPMSTLVPEMSALQLPVPLPGLPARLRGARRQRHHPEVLRRRPGPEGLQARRVHRGRLPGDLRPLPDQLDRRREGQEGPGPGGQDPGGHVQGARDDLDPDRVPRGGDGAPDEGDRLRRGRDQHLLPQQVLRHRQERGRRPPHPPGGRAGHVQGLVGQGGRRDPEGDRRGRPAAPSSGTGSSSWTRTGRSRTT